MAHKKVASSAARRAYRSSTTKKQRVTERKRVGKAQMSKTIKAVGGAIRKNRISKGLNPNTGKKGK